jgi:hypothetical protein
MIEQLWRVWKHNKFVGYVVSPSEWEATKMAQKKFGSFVFVERLI